MYSKIWPDSSATCQERKSIVVFHTVGVLNGWSRKAWLKITIFAINFPFLLPSFCLGGKRKGEKNNQSCESYPSGSSTWCFILLVYKYSWKEWLTTISILFNLSLKCKKYDNYSFFMPLPVRIVYNKPFSHHFLSLFTCLLLLCTL